MNPIYDNWELWQRLLTMLEHQFGNRCEFILHDYSSRDYDHSIVDIRNGHITNRKVGDCGSNLGLEVLRGTVKDGDRYNYIVNTRDGKLLRSSSMYLQDDTGKVIGCLCINTDITETVHFEEYLRQYNQYNIPVNQNPQSSGESPALGIPLYSTAPPTVNSDPEPAAKDSSNLSANSVVPEIFANDVSQILDYLIAEADKLIGKPVDKMNRTDKIDFVRYLDQKGAFLITKAAERVYEHLKISRYSLYNYLDLIHKEASGSAQEDAE